MCVNITLPDGRMVDSTSEFAELVEELGGVAQSGWREEEDCLCNTDVVTELSAVDVHVTDDGNDMDLKVPGQAKLPARYVCEGGPYAGRAPFRYWGDEPAARLAVSTTAAGGTRREYVYVLEGERYVLIKPKPRKDQAKKGTLR